MSVTVTSECFTLRSPKPKDRERTLDEIIAELRQKYSHITGPERVGFQTREEGPPAGKDVEVIVKGKYFDELEAITDELKSQLAQTPGVTDINDNYALGQEEIKLHIDEDKANEYGLTLQQIAFTARNAFEGAKATVFRDGDEEIDVVVKFSESARTTLKDVENLKLMGATGVPVPLRDVAQLSMAQGYSTIHRYKGERAITITANVDEEVVSGVAVNQRLRARFDKISPRYPGYTLESGGEFAEFQQVFRDIPIFFAFGIMLVYFITGNAVQVLPPTANYPDDRPLCIHRRDGRANHLWKPLERRFNIRTRRAGWHRR